MGVKVKEIAPARVGGPVCNPDKGGCCSVHRRKDRVYEDQVWNYTVKTGKYAFHDGSDADIEFHGK